MQRSNLENSVVILIPYQLPASMAREFDDAGVVSVVRRSKFTESVAELLEDAIYLRKRGRRK